MPSQKPKPKAHELTTEQVARELFPKKAREAVMAEAERSKKPGKQAKSSIKKNSS